MEKEDLNVKYFLSLFTKIEVIALISFITSIYVHSILYIYMARLLNSFSLFLIGLTNLSAIVSTCLVIIYSKKYSRELEKGLKARARVEKDKLITSSGEYQIKEADCNIVTMRLQPEKEDAVRIIKNPRKQREIKKKITTSKVSKTI